MRTEASLRYTINTHLYLTNEFQLLLNCVSLQSAGGWAGKGTVKILQLLSLWPKYLSLWCVVTFLHCFIVRLQKSEGTILKKPFTIEDGACHVSLSVAQTWNDLWPFLLHMTWMTFDLSFSTWQCVITGTRSATCLDHSTTPATKVQSNASIILPHFKRIFDDMKKQPLSWLLGKWSSISRTVAWNWTFACRGLWGLGGYLVLVRALVLEPVAPGLIWFWVNLGF